MQVWTCLGKDGADRVREALEAVDDRDQGTATPRFFSSFMTRSQNLAPSVCSIQMPRISLVPSGRMPTKPSSLILTRIASKKTSG